MQTVIIMCVSEAELKALQETLKEVVIFSRYVLSSKFLGTTFPYSGFRYIKSESETDLACMLAAHQSPSIPHPPQLDRGKRLL